MKKFMAFSGVFLDADLAFRSQSQLVHTAKWQGMDISKKPEMATHELLNHSFQVILPEHEDALSYYRREVKPNLPWADDHFLERVGGEPLNPGVQWAKWPYATSADRFRDHRGLFSHSYMERYWPKRAGRQPYAENNFGTRFAYGDLNDVVNQLVADPYTRQAYLPVWFPEDTGALHGGRLPCSLGYHFIRRENNFHIVYYLRSCDYVRHFRDDVYLTLRLMFWVLEQCKKKSPDWGSVIPFSYTMHITSFHLFRADWRPLFGEAMPPRG